MRLEHRQRRHPARGRHHLRPRSSPPSSKRRHRDVPSHALRRASSAPRPLLALSLARQRFLDVSRPRATPRRNRRRASISIPTRAPPPRIPRAPPPRLVQSTNISHTARTPARPPLPARTRANPGRTRDKSGSPTSFALGSVNRKYHPSKNARATPRCRWYPLCGVFTARAAASARSTARASSSTVPSTRDRVRRRGVRASVASRARRALARRRASRVARGFARRAPRARRPRDDAARDRGAHAPRGYFWRGDRARDKNCNRECRIRWMGGDTCPYVTERPATIVFARSNSFGASMLRARGGRATRRN